MDEGTHREGDRFRLDPERDRYQPLGILPAWVVGRLWPGFVPQDYEIAINPVYVSRHMRKGPDHIERAAVFARHARELPTLFAEAVAFARYDGVGEGEAGITVYARVEELKGAEQFIAVGVRMFKAEQDTIARGRRKPNHVTTVMPPVSGKRLRRMLARRAHCLSSQGDDLDPYGSDLGERV